MVCVCMGERKRFFLIEINLFLHICRNCAVELCTRKSLLILNLAMLLKEFSQQLKLTLAWQLAMVWMSMIPEFFFLSIL